jgi:DNA polymerase III alpha subunit (gram-positive type)
MIIKSTQEFYNFIANRSTLAYDIETTGLNPRKNEIIGFGVSDNAKGIYIPHLIWNGESLEEVFTKSECIEMVQALLSKKLIHKCFKEFASKRITELFISLPGFLVEYLSP